MKPIPQHAAAHIVTGLTAEHEVGEWHEPHGTQHNILYGRPDQPGVMYHARLGASGIQLIRGDIAVCIPLELLFGLAAEINPEFGAAPNKRVSPDQAAALAAKLAPATAENDQ